MWSYSDCMQRPTREKKIKNKKKEIKFAEWLAKNHYVLCNESKGIFYWENENSKGTSDNLYLIFKNENK